MCFSDESWITNNPCRGRSRMWCEKDEDPLPEETEPHPYKVCVWIAIAKGGIRAITVIDCTCENMNAERYQEVLEENLELFDQLRAKGIPFQENQHSMHKSEEWLRENQIVLPAHKWPARGADLSPVEQVNQWLKYRVAQRHVFGVEEIMKAVEEEFWKISDESIDKVIDSFHQRCRDVISAKGAPSQFR